MKRAISEIVVQAEQVGKSSVTVYRALRQLLCERCGRDIANGELFTRRTLFGRGLSVFPQCRVCPLQLIEH
jgi:RNase P subunit RPR2